MDPKLQVPTGSFLGRLQHVEAEESDKLKHGQMVSRVLSSLTRCHTSLDRTIRLRATGTTCEPRLDAIDDGLLKVNQKVVAQVF